METEESEQYHKGTKVKKMSIPVAILALISGTIALEGGYVNDKTDRGGETKYGITKNTAVTAGYSGPMIKLPKEVAESIYYQGYYVAPGYDKIFLINPIIPEELFDTGVNMGTYISSTFLQKSLNSLDGSKLPVDGIIGYGTVAALNDYQNKVGAVVACKKVITELDRLQLARYQAIVAANPSQKKFYKGWTTHRIGNVKLTKCDSLGAK